IGTACVAVTEDGSPRGPRTVAFWEPPLLTSLHGENGAPVRLGATTESARITADLVVEGARTLTFARSRRAAELIALHTRQLLAETDPELAERVAAYRGGYLPEERRALEAGLSDGSLLAAATTNALELGVDIAGLDAVVLAGFPGTVASFRQQIGRAGRRTQGALALLVARDDPLDTYLVHHPEALLNRPVEAAVIDPSNPYVLGPQLLCAAMELPLADTGIEGVDTHRVLDELAVQGMVRRRRTKDGHYWFHTGAEAPHSTVDIRGGIGTQVAIVVGETGRFLGTADQGRAPATLHDGAVHLHQGETYVVEELDLEGGVAFVREESPGWTTSARQLTSLTIDSVRERREFGQVTAALATVTVRSQVIGYLRTSLT
ncbi:MAG: helicase-related protein, partial [Stackebrandtia sp.]